MARANVYVPAHLDQLRDKLEPTESLSGLLSGALEERFGLRTRKCAHCGAEQGKSGAA